VAEKVVMWRSDDGALHPTEEAADADNARLRRRIVLADMLAAAWNKFDRESINLMVDFLDNNGKEVADILMRGR
jgi:hypothetical protein